MDPEKRRFYELTHTDIPVREVAADDTDPGLVLARALDPKGRRIKIEDPRDYQQEGPAVIYAKAKFYADVYNMYYDSPVMTDLREYLTELQNSGGKPTHDLVKQGVGQVLRQQILLPRK